VIYLNLNPSHLGEAMPMMPHESFANRHIGPSESQKQEMLKELECKTIDELLDKTVPQAIRMKGGLRLPSAMSEAAALNLLQAIARENVVAKSYLGQGYYGTHTPAVIRRNVLENPGWYTQYTPYQAEIAQGRLQALLNFQTVVSDLTGLPIANASLLDEGTAAGEAMTLAFSARKDKDLKSFFVADDCFEQTIELVRTKAAPLGIDIVVGRTDEIEKRSDLFGVLLQYPNTYGSVVDYSDLIGRLKSKGVMAVVAADILSLTLLKSPGEMGADIAVGSTQRFGVPLGYGGPHAAYFATSDEHKRRMPGRLVGVSRDKHGRPALRLTLQTREQHIRRDKATSNICTAQVLLAVMASMYAVYHGPEGLKQIALTVHRKAKALGERLQGLGYDVASGFFFDTIRVSSDIDSMKRLAKRADEQAINLRWLNERELTISVDETSSLEDLEILTSLFAAEKGLTAGILPNVETLDVTFPKGVMRSSAYLTHAVFNSYHTEPKLTRYIKRMENADLSLTHSMIPLGSCTMKLNAVAELTPVTWPEFNGLHPAAPAHQTLGYQKMLSDLETWLAEITGFAGVSLQPNSGAQGEYAGLLAIRAFHLSRNEAHRTVCLIPTSAHGTNPASAVLAGMTVVPVRCQENGDIDLSDLRAKSAKYKETLGALMVTYPSTHGVFEETIPEICKIVHEFGGQVYMDGANMNAQIGLCQPGRFGADVCHLNLHKTFCIPHGGGGPGVGPICVAEHLVPFLPSHPFSKKKDQPVGPVAAAPYGSASILPISWMYIRMMGESGLNEATRIAILNANYMAKRLAPHYPILFQGKSNMVAHECIIDLRKLKTSAGIEVEDVAKRLMDYGFHAPTISWPVPGTMMIEPTESEDKGEIDRFCDAMIAIRKEITFIEEGKWPRHDNPLVNAPHTAESVMVEEWKAPYSREQAAFPLAWVRERKFWPSVGRVDNAYGDRNVVCSCEGMDAYADLS
jgi:glycine dehydrogenase